MPAQFRYFWKLPPIGIKVVGTSGLVPVWSVDTWLCPKLGTRSGCRGNRCGLAVLPSCSRSHLGGGSSAASWCKLILSNNPSNATLWVVDTCLIIGLLPLILILLTVSLSSKKGQLRFTVRRTCVCDHVIQIVPVTFFYNLVLAFCKQCPAAPWVDDFLLFEE